MDLTKISILKKGNLFKEAKSLKENHASYFVRDLYSWFLSVLSIENLNQFNSWIEGNRFTFSGYPNFTIHMYGV